MKFNKRNTILLFVIAECVAVLGTMPLFVRLVKTPNIKIGDKSVWLGGFMEVKKSFWEVNDWWLLALFLVLVAGVFLLYMRYENWKLQLSALLIIIPLVLFTTVLVRTFI